VWSYREEKIKKGELLEGEWNTLFERYRESYPELARLLEKSLNKDWEEDYRGLLPEFKDAMATRQASGKVLASISKVNSHPLWRFCGPFGIQQHLPSRRGRLPTG